MARAPLKLGDIVRFATSQPRMVVAGIRDGGVTCLRWDGSDFQSHSFSSDRMLLLEWSETFDSIECIWLKDSDGNDRRACGGPAMTNVKQPFMGAIDQQPAPEAPLPVINPGSGGALRDGNNNPL